MVNCKKILYSGGKLHKTKTFHAICAILTNKGKRSLRLRLSHIDYLFRYTDSGGKAEEREREKTRKLKAEERCRWYGWKHYFLSAS